MNSEMATVKPIRGEDDGEAEEDGNEVASFLRMMKTAGPGANDLDNKQKRTRPY